jgi:hypothetical protein
MRGHAFAGRWQLEIDVGGICAGIQCPVSNVHNMK